LPSGSSRHILCSNGKEKHRLTKQRLEFKRSMNIRGDIMTNRKFEDYTETEQERNEGHVDTRKNNFECESPDKNLGCDLGVDVAG
jgi:hypothetical protein